MYRYAFCLVASPVGAYYKGGLQAIDAVVVEQYDRAAPRGVGAIKAAGNYAADLMPAADAKVTLTLTLILTLTLTTRPT